MNSSNMINLEQLQGALDLLLHNLRSSGCRLEIEHDLRAYHVLRESQRLWHDPAFARSPATVKPFWLAISDTRQQVLAIGAVQLIETESFLRTFETGKLWRQNGVGQPGIEGLTQDVASIDVQPPSRDPAGKVSYVQNQILERGRHIAELSWITSWLTQAMAFRLHGSQYAVSLVRSDLRHSTAQRTRESFARSEFCFSGLVPPLRNTTTLHLCQTSLDEYLTWAGQIVALGHQEVNQCEPGRQSMAFAS